MFKQHVQREDAKLSWGCGGGGGGGVGLAEKIPRSNSPNRTTGGESQHQVQVATHFFASR